MAGVGDVVLVAVGSRVGSTILVAVGSRVGSIILVAVGSGVLVSTGTGVSLYKAHPDAAMAIARTARA